ncbi:MAG: HypC/HybG/HupF family hydrogenase formation chaperone [Eggerthellaceae bacterium]|nr:HypC/HybG/HupF family hydrogenase formation chaperone [Eggerthellaceae bacterium]
MCLAIPAQVKEIEGNMAQVDIMGVSRGISVDLTPQAKVGDYVLVHAGFAIEVVSEEEAKITLDLLGQFPELIE